MNKFLKYIITAFLMLISVLCVFFATYLHPSDVSAVYTRNNLSWSGADASDDGSVTLDLSTGKTTIGLKNNVSGNIGYNLYLYTEGKSTAQVTFTAKGITEIIKKEYPPSLKDYDVKCAYSGYLDGNRTKNFSIKSTDSTRLKLLIIIEDNNSYPKEESPLPSVANIKFRAEVLLDGQYPRGNDYSFSLKDESGTVIETVHNDDGNVHFSNIALKKNGTYTYYLSQNPGKDKNTSYDNSIYKINVVAEQKNVVRVIYEKDGISKETLPRFSNYKEIKNTPIGNFAEYPTNEKKSDNQPNYLFISTLAIGVFLIILYIIMGKKKG